MNESFRSIGENTPKFNIKVMNNKETIDFIKKNHCSVSRFGDGELSIIEGNSASFETGDDSLRKKLYEIIKTPSNNHLLVCLNDIFDGLEKFTPTAREYWKKHLKSQQPFFEKLENLNNIYGSATVTRPYMDYQDRKEAKYIFDGFKDIWREKDLLIVEGCYTRSGVNNDLFSTAHSVQRIICPASNCWRKKNKIEKLIKKYGKGKIVLVMLGMTATVISSELSNFTQIIDLGHLDAEYDWFNMYATKKSQLQGKHTPETHDFDIAPIKNKKYKKEIIVDISHLFRIKNFFMGKAYAIYKKFK